MPRNSSPPGGCGAGAAAVHAKAKSLGWESTSRGRPYPTKYTIPKTAKGPFRHLLSEYYAMEPAKDHQQYGALEATHPRIANGPQPACAGWRSSRPCWASRSTASTSR